MSNISNGKALTKSKRLPKQKGEAQLELERTQRKENLKAAINRHKRVFSFEEYIKTPKERADLKEAKRNYKMEQQGNV